MTSDKKAKSSTNLPPAPPAPAASGAPVKRRLPPLLRRAWYNLNQAFRRRIAFSGLTPDQFTILRLLVEAPPDGLTQRELCVRMCSDPNTMASLLTRMESSGSIERRPHEGDRRAHRVTIAVKGRGSFQELRAIALDLQRAILETVPARRREQFLEDLERIADACQEQVRAEPAHTPAKKL